VGIGYLGNTGPVGEGLNQRNLPRKTSKGQDEPEKSIGWELTMNTKIQIRRIARTLTGEEEFGGAATGKGACGLTRWFGGGE